jgi:hypothetical protein
MAEATSSAARAAVAKTLVRPFIRFLSDSISGAEKRPYPGASFLPWSCRYENAEDRKVSLALRREPDHPLRRP